MAASKQASKQTYTHTHAQRSPASVGLTQARPNYLLGTYWYAALFINHMCIK